MSSSPENSRVMLPSFQQMMARGGEALPDDWDVEPLEEAHAPTKSEAQLELEKTQDLCANIRKEAMAAAEQILEQARQEAVSIVDKTRRETAARLEEEARAEQEANRQALFAAVGAFTNAQSGLYEALEPHLLDITFHIAQLILKYELSRSDEAYLSIIRSTLDMLYTDNAACTLHMSADGYDRLIGEDESGALMDELRESRIKVLRDTSIPAGDCYVESEIGGIRSGTNVQISRMKYAFSSQQGGAGE